MIIDAHAHVFPAVAGRVGTGAVKGVGYGRIKVGGADVQLMPPLSAEVCFTPEMLAAHLDWAGVDCAVLLQGPFYGPCNDYAAEAAARFPGRLRPVAYLNPWDADAKAQWGKVKGSGAFLGIKIEFSVETGLYGLHPHSRLDDPALDWLWRGLDEAGMTLTLDLGGINSESYQTTAVRGIATRHPGLQIVIAHLAQPSLAMATDPALRHGWEEQLDLAQLPNLAFDCSALPFYLQRHEAYPFVTAGGWIRTAIERIGADKVMWGTDAPALLGVLSYPQLLSAAKTHLSFLSEGERAAVLGGNARRIYKLG